jgi:hypothetical protein
MSLIVIGRVTIARLSSSETGAMLSSFTISGCKVEPERASIGAAPASGGSTPIVSQPSTP